MASLSHSQVAQQAAEAGRLPTTYEYNRWIAKGRDRACVLYSNSPGPITFRGEMLEGMTGCGKNTDVWGRANPWDGVNVRPRPRNGVPLGDIAVIEDAAP